MVFPNPKAPLPTRAFASSLHSMILLPLPLLFFSKSLQLTFFTLYITKSVPLRPTAASSFHATSTAACHAAHHLLSHRSLLLLLCLHPSFCASFPGSLPSPPFFSEDVPQDIDLSARVLVLIFSHLFSTFSLRTI